MLEAPPTVTDTELLINVPDRPEHIETRAMLLRGTAHIFGQDSHHCVLCDTQTSLITTFGHPPTTAILQAIQCYPEAETLITSAAMQDQLTTVLEGWDCHPAVVHVLDASSPLPAPAYDCRWLHPDEIQNMENASDQVRNDLWVASFRSRIVTALADGQPAAFCFASSYTDSWWNVSVVTLEQYRRKGFGTACVAWMTARWAKRNMQRVWVADKSNLASLAMASHLGFKPVEELIVFRRLII